MGAPTLQRIATTDQGLPVLLAIDDVLMSECCCDEPFSSGVWEDCDAYQCFRVTITREEVPDPPFLIYRCTDDWGPPLYEGEVCKWSRYDDSDAHNLYLLEDGQWCYNFRGGDSADCHETGPLGVYAWGDYTATVEAWEDCE
jgi:hypothetical protein